MYNSYSIIFPLQSISELRENKHIDMWPLGGYWINLKNFENWEIVKDLKTFYY